MMLRPLFQLAIFFSLFKSRYLQYLSRIRLPSILVSVCQEKCWNHNNLNSAIKMLRLYSFCEAITIRKSTDVGSIFWITENFCWRVLLEVGNSFAECVFSEIG